MITRSVLGDLDKNSLDLQNRTKETSCKTQSKTETTRALEAAKVVILEQQLKIQTLQMQLAFHKMKTVLQCDSCKKSEAPATTTPKKRRFDSNNDESSRLINNSSESSFTPQRVKWRDVPANSANSTPRRNRCNSTDAAASTTSCKHTPPPMYEREEAKNSDEHVSTLVDRLQMLEESIKTLQIAPQSNPDSHTPPPSTPLPPTNGSSVLEEKEDSASYVQTPVPDSRCSSPAVASFHHTLATRYDKDYKHDNMSYYNMKNLYQPTLSPLGDQGPGPSKVALSSLSNLQSKMSSWRSKYSSINSNT